MHSVADLMEEHVSDASDGPLYSDTDDAKSSTTSDKNCVVVKKLETLRSTGEMGSILGSPVGLQLGDEDQVRVATLLFSSLVDANSDAEGKGSILSGQLLKAFEQAGLQENDPRLRDVISRLNEFGGVRKDIDITLEMFIKLVKGNTILMGKAMQGKLIVPDFMDFRADLEEIFERVRTVTDGHVADYIPFLARQDPNLWSASVCTIDGQMAVFGDADFKFCVQSCCKPIAYLMASQENGFDYVHYHIGREPSGKSFNEVHLKDYPSDAHPKRKVPHNPMINAGAIMSCALINRDKSMANRFQAVMDVWNNLCGSECGFSNSVYLSEKDTADRNWCLGYMMQEFKSFPEGTNLGDTLQFYFQQCSILANTQQMSIMAATLANGGTNPHSGVRIFDPFHVRNCLSLMLSSGMYDYSGEWGFNIGLPAKSGVAGCVWVVVPNKMGIATFSPGLDSCGNSSRGVAFYTELVKKFNFHQFDNLRGVISSQVNKKDPTMRKSEMSEMEVTSCLFASAHGDLNELLRLSAQGADIFKADYDFRTGLHLAASEGHYSCTKFFVIMAKRSCKTKTEVNAVLSPQDRWGRTPLDDAISGGHQKCADFLKRHGAKRGAGERNNIMFTGQTDQRVVQANKPNIIRQFTNTDVVENLLLNDQSPSLGPMKRNDRSPSLGPFKSESLERKTEVSP